MREQLVMGNWKMNGSQKSIIQLLDELKSMMLNIDVLCTCVVLPPLIYLALVRERLINTRIQWGAQNVFSKNEGAYTGEHSASMLKDYHCRYVLVGHSERRQFFHEDVKFVAEKFHQVKDHDMIPILCIGETLEEREKGLTEQVLESQMKAIYRNPRADFQQCVIAYEPVWAIGTGQTATPDEAESVHAFIRSIVAQYSPDDAIRLPILYGGSVNEKNAQALFSMPNVDGGLVGGASLSAQQFLEIVKCINC